MPTGGEPWTRLDGPCATTLTTGSHTSAGFGEVTHLVKMVIGFLKKEDAVERSSAVMLISLQLAWIKTGFQCWMGEETKCNLNLLRGT